MRAALRGVRAAFVFLTRVPVGGFPYTDAEFAWAPAHFPLVGAVLGAALGTLDASLSPLGPWAAAALVLGASLLLTGAFHEDGLADTADALGGAFTREKVFEILKDSRIGAFGGVALAWSLLTRAALLAKLGDAAPVCLPFVFCAARTAPVWLLRALPYVTDDARARSRQVARPGLSQELVATGWLGCVALATAAFHATSAGRLAVAIAVVAAVAALCGLRFRARAGGLTGDFLGATEQLCEVAALAVLAWR